jgi:predicted dehydrogenase
MSKVRCAVIGAGWWATTAHIPALKKHPLAELVGVQKRSLESVRKIASDFEIPHACTTLEEILAVPDLQAVVISSTPNCHYDQAKACLQRGLHVLLEKPMTLTVAEAQELTELAAAKSLHLLISCPWHYTRHAAEARRLIQFGALGQVEFISILMTNFTQGLYAGLPWEKIFGGNSETAQNSSKPYLEPAQTSYSDASVAGGGQIYCQISHAAAYLGFLLGRPVSEVFARFGNGGTAVDVHDSLSIKLDDGAIVSIASTGGTMLSERNYEVRIYGTAGMLLMELWKGTMEFHNSQKLVQRLPDLTAEEIYPMGAPAENLIDLVAGQAENKSPGTLGLYAMEIIEASCRSVKENSNVRLAHP